MNVTDDMRETRDNNEWFNAHREAQVDSGADLAIYGIKPLQRELARYENRLELVRAKPRATDLNPNCWYVRRSNDALPDSYMLVDEPSYAVIDELKGRDLWNTDLGKRLQDMDRRNARRMAVERQARTEQYRERADSLDRLSVRF